MKRTLIKICGMTNAKDITFADTLDIDFIGLIFTPQSPRCIDVEILSTISEVKTSKKIVGVFLDQPREFIQNIIKEINLDYIQFHGSEDYSFCKSFNLPFFKTLHVRSDTISMWTESHQKSNMVVLDNQIGENKGGTGKIFDWNILKNDEILLGNLKQKKYLIAGGLSLDNIDSLLLTYNPLGVDVSSSLEQSIGHKNYDLMRNFVDHVRNYDEGS